MAEALEGAPPQERPSIRYAYYVLALLFVVYIFNFIDRMLLSILLDKVKDDLGATDEQMGFLTGFAFALFYTFAGIPIARWADRASRRSIIALGLAVWSAMTMASGLARNFLELALARVGVGIGEAAGTPPAHSLLSDYFPPERRATALALYSNGIYVGVMVAYVAGGYLYTAFDDWRTPFFVFGAPGLLLALLVRFTIRELPRGASETTPADTTHATLREVASFLFARRSFVFLIVATSFQALAGYAILAWGPTFLGRVHGMEPSARGLWLGLIVGIAGSLGSFAGGALSDRLAARDVRWYMWLSAIVAALGVPFACGFLLLDTPAAALLSFVPFYFVAQMYLGPMLWATQSLVRLRMRATASAILLFILNLVGFGAGPWLVGRMSDSLVPTYGEESLRYAMLVVILLSAVAIPFFLLSARSLPADLARRDAVVPAPAGGPA